MAVVVPIAYRSVTVRAALLGAGLIALTVAGIRLTDRADARRAVRQALADGARFDDSLTVSARATPSVRVSFPAAIALGYLARAQAGLGSPFRLVDLARTDPRLPTAWRPRVAHAILSRIARDTAVMRPMPSALDIAMPGNAASGRALLRVVDSVIALEGDSPLALDALRIAAAQASARGVLRAGAVPLLDAAALMAFDRARARRDVERAITAASRGDGDLLQVVALWRLERRFAAERPLLSDPAASPRRVAARIPQTLVAIEAAMQPIDSAPASVGVAPSPMTPNVARALSLLISVQTRPAQPQVRLSVLDARMVAADRRLLASPRVTRMLLAASNEESLLLSFAGVMSDSTMAPIAAAATLLAAQGMRTLAQEAAYHPGVLALRPEQVAERLGLASLTFGRDVPMSWQAYYAREFATAVDAARLVFPRANFAGLNVHIGDSVVHGALAVHDPRSRRLTLPLATGFGAVGHELLHDIDWQTARDHAGRTGAYATDHAFRGARNQPIAAPIARLAEFVPVGANGASRFTIEARRPAELLARGADWFLASALARQGRMNGALTAVQDSWLRGYASAAGPAAFGDHDAAMTALFDVIPMLSSRSSMSRRMDAEREVDLGTIARAAWLTPLPLADSLAAGRSPFPILSGAAASTCAPLARLRLAPIRATARTVAAGFIEPRVHRSMRRWARTTNPEGLPTNSAALRLAVLGAPVNPSVVDSARAAWVATAWRVLPCLAP